LFKCIPFCGCFGAAGSSSFDEDDDEDEKSKRAEHSKDGNKVVFFLGAAGVAGVVGVCAVGVVRLDATIVAVSRAKRGDVCPCKQYSARRCCHGCAFRWVVHVRAACSELVGRLLPGIELATSVDGITVCVCVWLLIVLALVR